jgi:hypothetical protein
MMNQANAIVRCEEKLAQIQLTGKLVSAEKPKQENKEDN